MTRLAGIPALPLVGIMLWLLVQAPSMARPELSKHQRWAVIESAKAGAYYDDGRRMEHGFTQTFQAIIAQESSFCFDKHNRDPDSWGCGQLKLSTAQIFDSTATPAKLLNQDRYNIWLSAVYLSSCRDHAHNWEGMVRCYHGTGSRDWREYVAAIRHRLTSMPRGGE